MLVSILMTVWALFGLTTVFAQTPTVTGSPIISDYAKDVQDGEKMSVDDQIAQNNQKEIKDVEDVEGREEVEDVEVKEKVEPQEAVEQQEVESENAVGGSQTQSQNDD